MGHQNRCDENSTSLTPVLAIVAPVREEARYLMEWLAYHRVLGIDTFLLADNGGNDTTSGLLQELDRHGMVKRFDWRGQTKFQLEFYYQAIQVARSFAEGLFFVDVDEFLRPENQMSIADVARTWLADPTLGGVALNWAIYGSSGREECDSGLVIERFTRRAPQEFSGNKHAKTFVRVGCWAGPAENPHAVTLDSGRYVDTRGEDVTWDTSQGRPPLGITTKVIWDMLRVDHFILKSREEFAALKQALDKYEFDAAFGGARRDEEKSRAKERIFSLRSFRPTRTTLSSMPSALQPAPPTRTSPPPSPAIARGYPAPPA